METSIPSELDGIPVEDREVSTTVPPPAEDEDEGMLETNEYEEEDEDDVMDGMTESGRTEDDLLQDAFRQALGDGDEDEGDDDDDDGDEIVWNPRSVTFIFVPHFFVEKGRILTNDNIAHIEQTCLPTIYLSSQWIQSPLNTPAP